MFTTTLQRTMYSKFSEASVVTGCYGELIMTGNINVTKDVHTHRGPVKNPMNAICTYNINIVRTNLKIDIVARYQKYWSKDKRTKRNERGNELRNCMRIMITTTRTQLSNRISFKSMKIKKIKRIKGHEEY